MNDDLLLRAARAYDDLTKYEYYLQLGKKGVTRNVHLRFPAEAFHHAAGLKKLNDSTMLKESRKKNISRYFEWNYHIQCCIDRFIV